MGGPYRERLNRAIRSGRAASVTPVADGETDTMIVEDLVLFAGENGYGVAIEPGAQWSVSFIRGNAGGIDEIRDSSLHKACELAWEQLQRRIG